jgi:Fe-S cluster assembly protein SufD
MSSASLSHHDHDYRVPVQTRSERFKSTKVDDFEPVSKRDEAWRYFDLSKLAELDQPGIGEYTGNLSLTESAAIKGSWVGADHLLVGAAGTPDDRTSAAAWQAAGAAYLVELGGAGELHSGRLDIAATTVDPEALHLVVHAATGTSHQLVIAHTGRGTLGENVEIVVDADASLTLVSVQQWDSGSTHLANHHIKLARGASLKHVVITLGGDTVRVTPSAVFGGENASVELLGLYFAESGQYQEHRLFVDHAVPNCKSRVTYKGALQGEKAHTVWVGDVLIRAAAEGTDTYELNRNLFLTDGARADSVPNLEIETGEIVGAGHASASGRFDDEQLFYFQARGISEQQARQLVVRGFLNEIVQQIGDPILVEELTGVIESKLARSGS